MWQAVGSDEVEIGVAALAGFDQAFGLLFDIGKLKAPARTQEPFQQLVGGKSLPRVRASNGSLGRQHRLS